MNLAQIRSRTQLRVKDLDTRSFDPDYINFLTNEALRAMAFETLMLEGKDSSLTYSSANDGFAVPSDFIRVKRLEWLTSNNNYWEIKDVGLNAVRVMRNQYVDFSEDTIETFNPNGYAVFNGHIILDSTTSSSPTLYYYKYDTALSSDTSTPSFDSEYHPLLVEYNVWQLLGDGNAQMNWLRGINDMRSSKRQGGHVKARHVSL